MIVSAAVTRAPDAAPAIETLELAAPREGELIVRLVATGICHTDLFAPSICPLPAVFGHEGAGIVAQVGAGVTKVRPGDRVVMTFGSCGRCRHCAGDAPAYCEQGHALQFAGTRADGSTTLARDGEPVHGSFFQQSSFATHALGTERSVVPLPAGMPLELAAPFGCGVQTGVGTVLWSLRAPAGASIAVFGAGTVGLSAIMAARYARLSTIVAVDIDPARLDLALESGATHVLDARDGDVAARIHALVRGGAMYSIETSAALPALNDAIACLARRGECALVTVPALGAPVPFSLLPLLTGGRRLIAVLEGDSVPDRAIPQLAAMHRAGQLPVGRLVAAYEFTDIGRALADAAAGRAIKPILRF
ncbi:MAG: NAD(P)-dependent alcohol dehydrogenase [Steroidobacteraceae bacterium]